MFASSISCASSGMTWQCRGGVLLDVEQPATHGGLQQTTHTGPEEGRPRGSSLNAMTLSDGEGRENARGAADRARPELPRDGVMHARYGAARPRYGAALIGTFGTFWRCLGPNVLGRSEPPKRAGGSPDRGTLVLPKGTLGAGRAEAAIETQLGTGQFPDGRALRVAFTIGGVSFTRR